MQNTDNKNQVYLTQDVDAYTDNVDNLMDDLFGDVESTLHVDYAKQRSLRQKSTQTKQNKNSNLYASVSSSASDVVALSRIDYSEKEVPTSKDTINISKLNVADLALPPISKQDVLWIQPYIMRNPEPTNSLPETPSEPVVSKYNLVDRLLLVFACSSALVASVMWTVNQGIWIGRQSVNTVAQVAPKEPSNLKTFGDEVRRMLSEVVDKNRAIATNNSNGSNLPLMVSPLVGGIPLPTGASNPFANGMQQPMYVPVYQPPSLNGSNAPSPLVLPPATSNNSVDLSATASKQNVASTQVMATPAISYTLIGVLDLGDRSTAMFDINGSVQSIGLGKTVSNTGWTLARVSQQEIILKRGKETKTIFVGQKF